MRRRDCPSAWNQCEAMFVVRHMAETQQTRRKPEKGGVSQWRLWLLALLLVAGLVFAAFHWGDLKRFAELVGRAQPMWLGGALVLQLSTYVLLSIEWSLVLRAGESARPLRKLLPLTITKLFADQVVPTAGMSGNVLLIDRLTKIGVPRK